MIVLCVVLRLFSLRFVPPSVKSWRRHCCQNLTLVKALTERRNWTELN